MEALLISSAGPNLKLWKATSAPYTPLKQAPNAPQVKEKRKTRMELTIDLHLKLYEWLSQLPVNIMDLLLKPFHIEEKDLQMKKKKLKEVFEKETFTECKWSKEGDFISIVSQKGFCFVSHATGDLVYGFLSAPEMTTLFPVSLLDSDWGNILTAQLVDGSRKILFGTEKGVVTLFDFKTQKFQQIFQSKEPVKWLTIDLDQSHFCFSQSNSIYLYNRSYQTCRLIKTFDSRVQCGAFSLFKKSLLACGMENGSVALLDLMDEKKSKLFPGLHECQVAQVTFSPFNRFLLVTTALDQKFCLMDVEKKLIVRQVNSQVNSTENIAPFTSIAFKNDGALLGLGSIDGKIWIYDLALNGAKVPVFHMSAHSEMPVTSLTFQQVTPGFKTVSEWKALIQVQQLILPAVDFDHEDEEADTKENFVKKKVNLADQSVNFMEMFSPVTKDKKKIIFPQSRKNEEILKEMNQSLKSREKKDPIGNNITVRQPIVLKEKEDYQKEKEEVKEEEFKTPPSTPLPPVLVKKTVRFSPEVKPERVESAVTVNEVQTEEVEKEKKKETHLLMETPQQNMIFMEQKLNDLRRELKQDYFQLHLEILRQFEIQKIEMREMMADLLQQFHLQQQEQQDHHHQRNHLFVD